MKWSQSRAADAAAVLSLLLAPVSAMLDCSHIRVDGQKFDFSPLSGPHSVSTWQRSHPWTVNTTYTLDLCAPLKKSGDVPANQECPNGARVCAIRRDTDPGTDKDDIVEIITIAGDVKGPNDLDPKATRLKTATGDADAKKEGIRLVLHGGPLRHARKQQAVIELLCDRTRTGLEGEWDPKDDKYEKNPGGDDKEGDASQERKRADEGDGKDDGGIEHQFLKDNATLIFDGYGQVSGGDDNTDVLRLTWHTKYACEDLPDSERENTSTHWGFFTWVVLLFFLGTATYLIFGSWLNYNRYGARGWDLLPHGDTLRDVPYLLKDWTRRALNTVQGSGSRGGYSAV